MKRKVEGNGRLYGKRTDMGSKWYPRKKVKEREN